METWLELLRVTRERWFDDFDGVVVGLERFTLEERVEVGFEIFFLGAGAGLACAR